MKHLSKTPKVQKTVKVPIVPNTPANGFLGHLYRATSFGLTENGALTFTRSGSALLDFYAQAGSIRKNPDAGLQLFTAAYSEDHEKALKILFYLRDVRGGQGERTLFRNCMEWLGTHDPKAFNKVIHLAPEYGRWDDILFNNDTCFELIKKQLILDAKSDMPTLLAKWLPTMNASSPTTRAKARFVAEKLGLDEQTYRKCVRSIRAKIATVEEMMSANEWGEINYSAVPSQAARIYKNAFAKHDETRYAKFIEKAVTGEVKINAGTLYPYQIYNSAQNDYSPTLEALWKQLPDYTMGKNAIVVADTSGSMSGEPMSVSVSLALYFAERNIGQFKDYFISFTDIPKLHRITGKTLLDRMNSIELGDVANTNLQAVFDLILGTAVANNTPESELPETIYIISDMEFDSCVEGTTNYEAIKRKYANAGYKMPSVVFWQVNSHMGKNLPVQQHESGVALVSGFSPSIFKMAVENKTPIEVMMDTINAPRYDAVTLQDAPKAKATKKTNASKTKKRKA